MYSLLQITSNKTCKCRAVFLRHVDLTYPGLLDEGAERAAPYHQQILDASSLNALLLTDLATHLSTAPQVQERDELRERIHDAALAQLLGILTEDVAWAEVGDNA